MTGKVDSLGSLAQYVLVSRIAAAALTFVVLAGRPRWQPALLIAFVLLVGLNYGALRRWNAVVVQLRVSSKPHYLLLDATLATALLAAVGIGTPLVLYLVGTLLLAGLLYSARITLAADVALTVAYVTVLVGHSGFVPGEAEVHTVVTLPALLLAAGAGGIAVKRLLLRQERSAREISALRELAAVREERLRMARDLHDSVTKNLHGVWLLSRGVDAALNRGDDAAARSCSAAVSSTALDLAQQSRGLISGLREDDRSPLGQALSEAGQRLAAGHRVEVHVDADELGDVHPDVRHELLAIAQEAVHNSVKHAAAQRIAISVTGSQGRLRLIVSDDGRGFEQPIDEETTVRPGHFGLLGMRERAGRIGGALTVVSEPGRGTRVEVVAPQTGITPMPSGVRPVLPTGSTGGAA
ncbi:MAG TPA: ATP-binding protein, partial [Kineosporiaceae bacterium]|nr:ATP-binding protein [Kineosporiaceae bacterium]